MKKRNRCRSMVKKPGGKRRRVLTWLIPSVVAVVAAAVAFLCFFTDYFSVVEVRMHGCRNLPVNSLQKTASGYVGANILTFPLAELRGKFMDFPEVREVTFKRRLFHKIDCYLREREPVALVSLDEIAEVDREGVVIPVASGAGQLDLPVITGISEEEIGGSSGRGKLAKALEVLELLKIFGFSPAEQLSEIHMDGENVVLVWIDTGTLIQLGREQFQERVRKLRTVYQALEEQGPFPQQIDLRFERQVVIR